MDARDVCFRTTGCIHAHLGWQGGCYVNDKALTCYKVDTTLGSDGCCVYKEGDGSGSSDANWANICCCYTSVSCLNNAYVNIRGCLYYYCCCNQVSYHCQYVCIHCICATWCYYCYSGAADSCCYCLLCSLCDCYGTAQQLDPSGVLNWLAIAYS